MNEPLQLQHPDEKPARRPLDKYRTPTWVTAALIASYPEIHGELLLDPCAGDGRMPRALIEAGLFPRAITNDIDPDEATDTHYDCCDPAFWELGSMQGPAWCVTNPPFLEAGRLAWHAIQQLRRGGIALLLRATWLEPTEERQWLGRFPPKAELVLPRFSFIGGGPGDSAGCRWLLWGDVEPGIKVWVGKPGQGELFNGR